MKPLQPRLFQQPRLIATVCTVASVIGGIAGYGIGVFLFEEVGRRVLEFYG
jgi:membrane protein YqaA with SNARE-associated domain